MAPGLLMASWRYSNSDLWVYRPIYDAASSIEAKVNSDLKQGERCRPLARSEDLVSIQSKLSLISIGNQDKPFWTASPYGKFSCAAAWNQLSHKEMEVVWWKSVWLPQAIQKHAFMEWLTLKNRLTTKNRPIQWGFFLGIVIVHSVEIK